MSYPTTNEQARELLVDTLTHFFTDLPRRKALKRTEKATKQESMLEIIDSSGYYRFDEETGLWQRIG